MSRLSRSILFGWWYRVIQDSIVIMAIRSHITPITTAEGSMMGEKIEMRAGVDVQPRQGVTPQGFDTSHHYDRIGSVDDIRKEIDDAFSDMRDFYLREPDEVMRAVSGHLARLAEISKEIRRIEGSTRQLKSVRSNEIDPAMSDLWQQFQIASRLQSVREMDWRTSGAQT